MDPPFKRFNPISFVAKITRPFGYRAKGVNSLQSRTVSPNSTPSLTRHPTESFLPFPSTGIRNDPPLPHSAPEINELLNGRCCCSFFLFSLHFKVNFICLSHSKRFARTKSVLIVRRISSTLMICTLFSFRFLTFD